MTFELRAYESKIGRNYYREWLASLDRVTELKIVRRVTRLELGNFGDVRAIGEGLSELRIDYGPGYRVYYGRQNREIILLLCGSDKSGQDRAIAKAKELWREYRETK
jgi:putative addiction module killer protein